jgi:hypothetical protein
LENDDLPYCAAVDTATLPTVMKIQPNSPNPPQCAYRAHNETDPSKSLTYLNIQQPFAIKLEDFPMSETVPTDEHCYSTSNAPSNAPANFYLADDPEPLPGPAMKPEPMEIELIEEELPAIVEANQLFAVPYELPVANIQQPVRMLPPLFPNQPLRHPNPLDKIHHHPFCMFQDPLHHPLSDLYFSNRTFEGYANGPIHCVTYTSAFASVTPSLLSASRFSPIRQKSIRFATKGCPA